MNNALWLLASLPEWYFSTLLAPLSAGPLSLVPALGALSLIAGIGLGISVRRRDLWLFGIPFLLTEALVAFAGFYRGQVDEAISKPVLLIFLALILLISVSLVWRMQGARLPALLLAIFSVTYGLFGAFVAAMSFSDNWL